MKTIEHACDAASPALPRVVAAALVALLVAAPWQAARSQNAPYQSPRRGEYGTGLGQAELPLGAVWEPRLEVAAQYANNINLSETSAGANNAAGLELAPGFYASYSTERLTGAVDYSLVGRAWDNSDFNDISQVLSANGRWLAFGEIFSIGADAQYSDFVADPAAGINYGQLGIFGSSNLIENAAASVTPTLRKRFSELEAIASYRHSRNWYIDDNDGGTGSSIFGAYEDLVVDDLRGSIGTARTGRKVFGVVRYESQRTSYEISRSIKYERAAAEMGFQATPALAIVAEVGAESSLEESTSDGGLGSDYWYAGLRWDRDEELSAEVRVGRRFFGDSYFARISRQMRRLRIDASYEDSVRTETRVGVPLSPGSLPTLNPANPSLSLVPGASFVSREGRFDIGAEGSRTSLTVGAFNIRRRFLNGSQVREESSGVGGIVSRRLAANLSLDLSARYLQTDRFDGSAGLLFGGNVTVEDTEVILRGNRTVGRHLITSLEAGYLERSGAFNFDGWWVGMRGRWLPRQR